MPRTSHITRKILHSWSLNAFWREGWAVVYNCWSTSTQSFWGPSPEGFMITFYCLRFDTPPTWRARSLHIYPPETRWPSYTHRHWIPFSLPQATRKATAEVFEPASTLTREPDAYQCHSQIYFTTRGLPSISSSWRQAPWDPRPVFFF
jgi:hypothetical protein